MLNNPRSKRRLAYNLIGTFSITLLPLVYLLATDPLGTLSKYWGFCLIFLGVPFSIAALLLISSRKQK